MIGKTVSHYRILEKLGEGGMGVVYKAEDMKLERMVALKFLPRDISITPEDRARFLQEARAASAVSHPNVCVIHDIADHEGQQFIVMEYVEGRTLGQLVPIEKTQDALGYAIQIGEALQEAHSRGVVHRDIKADNVMVGRNNVVKVMDFGLAKLKGSLKLTRTSSTVGTLAYMAPEQIRGADVDARSDIFSFGVLLYEMLAGHLPFAGEHEAAIMYSIVNEDPQPIQKYRPDVSSEILHIVNRALEKDPDDRYQTVREMVIDLRRAKKETSRVSRPVYVPPAAEQVGAIASVKQTVSAGLTEPSSHRKRISSRRLLWLVLAGTVAVAAIVLGVRSLGHPPRLSPNMSFRTLDVPFTEMDFAAISRDGSWVAFSAKDAGKEWSLYFMNVAKGEPRRLVTEHYSGFDYTEISPDNSEVLYGARRSGMLTDIYIVSSAGGTSRKITDGGIGARWRPDGQLIGYIKDASPACPNQSGKFEFWTVKPDGGANRLMFVDSLCYLWSNYCFDWSPRGDQIAWLRSFPGYGEIFIRDLKTGRERQLTHYRKPITEMAWATNGQVFFTSSRSGNTNVWMIPARGGEAVQVTKGSGPDYTVRVSADARRLLYLEQQRVNNLWTANVDGSGARQLTFENQYLNAPCFSPDKKRIAFNVNSADQLRPGAQVFVMQADGSNRVQITHGDGTFSSPTWSPDGKYLTYGWQAADEPFDSSNVYLVDASDPGTPRLVGRGAHALWIDNDSFVAASLFPKTRSAVYSLGAAEPIAVSPDSTYRFPLPDGVHSVLWDLRTRHAGWWLETGRGGQYEIVTRILSSDYCFRANISSDLRYVVYMEPDGQLWRASLPEGKRERLPSILTGINPVTASIDFSLDGKSVVYVKTRLEARLVLIENLFK